jgi:LuxR family maltose regulon positive regulatory protein
LSLDENDNDLARFLSYLIAALQTIQAGIGEATLATLRAQPVQPSSATWTEAFLTPLVNEIAAIPADPSTDPGHGFVLVLDDYHVINTQSIHDALTCLLDHLPPQLHLIMASRSEPPLPLARLRARNQLLELRTADLRFTSGEAATFLNQVMGLNLSAGDVAALESRTEGWIAGLQLAALAMQGALSMHYARLSRHPPLHRHVHR